MTMVPARVLTAFGVGGEPRLLSGGKGRTWRVGDTVLKPAEGDAETCWRAEVLTSLPRSTEFRTAAPVRSFDGTWIAHGWEAQRAVAGHPDQRRVDEVVQVGMAFHRALADLPRPEFLDTRADPWAIGDQLAWGTSTLGHSLMALSHSELLGRLLAARRPVAAPSQVVHGDLLGNILFADGLAPAVIDWTAYWRPPVWSYAVAVIDALTWHGADADVLRRWAHLAEWDQMLVRALIYRLANWKAARWPAEPTVEYRGVVDAVLARIG